MHHKHAAIVENFPLEAGESSVKEEKHHKNLSLVEVGFSVFLRNTWSGPLLVLLLSSSNFGHCLVLFFLWSMKLTTSRF